MRIRRSSSARKRAYARRPPKRYRLSSLIRWYITTFKDIANWGRTKQTTLEFLERPVLDPGRLDFAYASSKRIAEICRLLWSDNDRVSRTGIVRDAKHPTAKEGNHRRFKYTPEAWAIVERQPKSGPRIFPYNPKTVGNYFTKACKVLGVENLRFHDSRHEAMSQLFERG